MLQPEWADSEKWFNTKQALRTASMATDKGDNERAVKVCKRAGFISSGFHANVRPKTLDNTWGFQANFMYNPIQ